MNLVCIGVSLCFWLFSGGAFTLQVPSLDFKKVKSFSPLRKGGHQCPAQWKRAAGHPRVDPQQKQGLEKVPSVTGPVSDRPSCPPGMVAARGSHCGDPCSTSQEQIISNPRPRNSGCHFLSCCGNSQEIGR